MFKKALLSTLVSVFLTLSIFTVATAFGETTPSGNPPNGLASPTFGGITVNGNSNFTGEMNVRDAFYVGEYGRKSRIIIGKTNGENEMTDIYGGIFFRGNSRGIYNASYLTSPNGFAIGIGNSAGGVSLGFLMYESGQIMVNGPLVGFNTELQISGSADITTNLDIHGHLENSSSGVSPVRIYDPTGGLHVTGPTTITGKLKTKSIGTWTFKSSSSDVVGNGEIATATSSCYATRSDVNAIAVSCEFGTNLNSANVPYNSRSITVSHLGNTGCFASAVMPAGGSITSYAMCFDPSI